MRRALIVALVWVAVLGSPAMANAADLHIEKACGFIRTLHWSRSERVTKSLDSALRASLLLLESKQKEATKQAHLLLDAQGHRSGQATLRKVKAWCKANS